MKKRIISIFLTIISLFTVIVPVSAYGENAMEDPYYHQTFINVQKKDAWGSFEGDWYCKTWTGKKITPKVKVKLRFGYWDESQPEHRKYINYYKELVEGQDYVKEYGNNVDMGYCRLKVTGTGDYTGIDFAEEAFATSAAGGMEDTEYEQYLKKGLLEGPIFVIRPLGTTLNKVTPQKKAFKVTWKCQAKKMSVKRITGYQIQYSANKNFKGGTTKTVTVKGYKNTAKTIKKLKANKKYYVRIRTYYQCKDGFKAYSTWSKAKAFKTK